MGHCGMGSSRESATDMRYTGFIPRQVKGLLATLNLLVNLETNGRRDP